MKCIMKSVVVRLVSCLSTGHNLSVFHRNLAVRKMVRFICAIIIVVLCIVASTGSVPQRNRTRCTSNFQCPDHLECKNRQCIDPCIDKVCATNADCTATNHRAICSCLKGFSGHPLTECKKEEVCTYNPDCSAHMACRHGKCVDPCATECNNTSGCYVISHVPFCNH